MKTKLLPEEWEDIKYAIQEGANISKLAKKYDITRNSIYVYGHRRGWFKKQTLPEKIISWIKKQF